MNRDRAEKIMNIDQRIAALMDDMVDAINAGQTFEVERIITEMDHLQEQRKETMELNPLKVSHG